MHYKLSYITNAHLPLLSPSVKILYTGMQLLVFHCYAHVIHGGSICQIYTHVEHGFPLVMLYTAV